ncbi:hypothetical protein BC829DRAFT_216323 [Chytridium lagenaria]|nr:hypothetical protein BC829DRAFT_216323 [Chytridium lagenaria]
MDPKTGNGGNGNTSSDEYSDSPSDIDSSDGEATGSTSSSPPSSSSSSPSLRQSGTGRKPLYSSKLRNVTNFDDLGSPASTTGPSPQTASAPPRPENDSDNEDHERSRYASQLPSRGSTYLDGAPIAPVAMAEMAAQRLTNFELEPDRAPDSS